MIEISDDIHPDDEDGVKPTDRLKVRFTFSGAGVAEMTTAEARELFGLSPETDVEDLIVTMPILAEHRSHHYEAGLRKYLTSVFFHKTEITGIEDPDDGCPLWPGL